ncbi:hypothetical protein [Pseudomonas sp. S60]|nr:hypothetical protein [Pseudomonas sp. S60]
MNGVNRFVVIIFGHYIFVDLSDKADLPGLTERAAGSPGDQVYPW